MTKRIPPELIRRPKVSRGGLSTTAEYKAWQDAIRRCENPKNENYPRYGGRGIRVCQQWRASFEDFLAYIGPRPSLSHSLDRIDNNGHYEPGNVRWATRRQQDMNKRPRRPLTHGGRTAGLSQWAAELGIDSRTLAERISRWGVERALSTPKLDPSARRFRPGHAPNRHD